MINPAELVDGLVTKLRDIPELVAEMNGDPGRIYAYHDAYPKRISLPLAVYEMPAPAILVAWQGTEPGSFGDNEAWKHTVSLFLRAGETPEEPPTAYYRLFSLIVNGVPTGSGQKLLYTTIHEGCYPMDTPSIQRVTDEQGTDYFETAISFTEIGDN